VCSSDLVRSFLVVVFIRFALGLAVALNSGVDYLFLDQQLLTNKAEIENFKLNLTSVDPTEELDGDSIRDSVIAFWEGLSVDELNRKISRGIENFINLVAIYLLKTILFPLGFFYGVIFVVRQLWRIDLNSNPLR
jgi:hypothetical protein